jgi:hypothetical protein
MSAGLRHRDAAQAIFATLQVQARQAGVTLREPPPEPSTCCGRGCDGCVWSSYYEAVAYWEQEALLQLQPGEA